MKEIRILATENVRDGKEADAEDLDKTLWGMEVTRELNTGKRIPKLTQFRDYILEWKDEDFTKICRINKIKFQKLVGLIENNSVFHNNSHFPQRGVYIKLAVTLKRLSHEGSDNSVEQLAAYFAISKGSVTNYIRRYTHAIQVSLERYMEWPTKEERVYQDEAIRKLHYFRNCIGFIDGTHLTLSQKPTVDGDNYFNRKSRHTLNCQSICDDRKVIFCMQIGKSGSVAYASCIVNSTYLRNVDQAYFSTEGPNHEYLLGDSGYSLYPYILTPYRRPQVVNSIDNFDFNLLHSSARVAVENTIGMLKGRWRFLKNIPTQLNSEKKIENIDDSIVVCAILHNFLIIENDEATLTDIPDDATLCQSRTEVTTLSDLSRSSIEGNRWLYDWKESVKDVLLADHTAEHMEY